MSALGDEIRQLYYTDPDQDAYLLLAEQVEALEANPRDEYHTMDELYEYRMLYNAHAAERWPGGAGVTTFKSRRHSDGELCFDGGWFIVGVYTFDGWVTNHYKNEHWDLFDVPEWATAPEWDGHTPAEAAQRLRNMLRGMDGEGSTGA